MTEAEAESYLLELELFGVRLGLERMRRLTATLGHPERRSASIHVVGSNGKSSTARMIAAILARHRVRVGLYTSPHLRSFAERIEVDGEPIPGEELAAAVTETRAAAATVDAVSGDPEDRVTQFEALTAAAFWALAHRQVEAAVVEAGLGGRLDATNVIRSQVQVLTSVSVEHAALLGPTPAAIATEKLAVVEDGGTLVIGELEPALDAQAEEVARGRGARLVRATAAEVDGVALGPHGGFQRRNLAVARAAAEAFLGSVEEPALRRAAAEVRVPGRLEILEREPLVVHDAAHNPAGARALAEALPEIVADRPLVAVLGALDDKDVAGLLAPLLALSERALLTSFAHPRALPAEVLAGHARALGHGERVELAAAPSEALARARALAGPDGAILVAGSIHLLAELRAERPAARLSSL